MDIPREYNVVTNKYTQNHDNKVKCNDEIMKAEAAKSYWKRNDFDPIRGQFYDQTKENGFVGAREAESQIHGQDYCKKLPITVQNDGLMYNPINMKVEDPQRLIDKDVRDKNKKKRYEVRQQVEVQVREEGLAEQDRNDEMALRRISHKHTEEQVGRGFNILTNGQLDNGLTIIRDQNTEYLKNPASTWQQATGAQPSACSSKPQSSAAHIPNVEMQRTQFGERSNRINLLQATRSH